MTQKLIDLADKGWTTEKVTHEDIRTGCFLKVAAEVAILNADRVALQLKIERLEGRAKRLEQSLVDKCNSNRALRGHVTRLKRKTTCATK